MRTTNAHFIGAALDIVTDPLILSFDAVDVKNIEFKFVEE